MGGQCYAPTALPPGKDSLSIVEEVEWVPGPVWKGAVNLAPTGIRSPDHQALIGLLHRLHYPAHVDISVFFENPLRKLEFHSQLKRTTGNLHEE